MLYHQTLILRLTYHYMKVIISTVKGQEFQQFARHLTNKKSQKMMRREMTQ